MQKYTEKVYTEKEEPEVVWIKRIDSEEKSDVLNKTETEAKESDGKPQLPIVYSKEYGVHFAKLEKLHPFDAQKGKNIKKVQTYRNNLKQIDVISRYFIILICVFRFCWKLKW